MDDLKIDASETLERQDPPEPIIENSGKVTISIQYDETGIGVIEIRSPDIGIQYCVDNIQTDSVRGAKEKQPRSNREALSSNWKEFEPDDTITTTISGAIRPGCSRLI